MSIAARFVAFMDGEKPFTFASEVRLAHFIATLVGEEREACAKIAEADEHTMAHCRNRIAARIRGQKL